MILLRKIIKQSIHIRSASWYVDLATRRKKNSYLSFSISFRINELARFSDGSAIAQVIISKKKQN